MSQGAADPSRTSPRRLLSTRLLIAFCLLLSSLLFTSVKAGATSGLGSEARPFDADAEECYEAVPEAASIAGVIDDGHVVYLDVHVLLDGVSQSRGSQVMEQVKKAYAPLKIDIRSTFQQVSIPAQRIEAEVATSTEKFPTSDSAYLFEQSKKATNGTRPEAADVVYLLTSDRITGTTAGVADCIGGVRYPNRAFAIGEEEADSTPSSTLNFCCTWVTSKIAAHEIAHLMGAHHHYANCAEGAPTAVADRHMLTCTVMFNDIGAVNLHFSALEAAVVRGHALKFADRAAPSPQPEPEPEPEPEPTQTPTQETIYTRMIDFELVRHVVARGVIDDGDSSRCAAGVMVEIQRRQNGEWLEVASVRTGSAGRFHVRLKDRSGTYRSVVPETSGTDGGETYSCSAAASTQAHHRH